MTVSHNDILSCCLYVVISSNDRTFANINICKIVSSFDSVLNIFLKRNTHVKLVHLLSTWLKIISFEKAKAKGRLQ